MFAELSLDLLLAAARLSGVSDIHLSSRSPMYARKYGVLQAVDSRVLTEKQMKDMLQSGLPGIAWDTLRACGDLEMVLEIPGKGRYRLTVVRHRGGWSLTGRVIDQYVRSMEDAGLPSVCHKMTQWAQGLVLIVGPAGSGKTSTLATMVEMINQERAEHIITIENPIEFVFTPKKSQISQRQVGVHSISQETALRAAMREDPDVIVVGEMRDLTTCHLAVSAAETGHLVFATMNTNDASQTLNALINSFPPEEQSAIRNMVAESLRGVVCQQLIPRKDGAGVVGAFEILMNNAAVASMIKSGRSKQLNNVIATGKGEGMLLLDDSLKALVDRQVISVQEAYARAINPASFIYQTGTPHG